ncbi:unnamed protein product [Durusdinium trenchii]|uniref:Uncharacterized protein n=1 Tax=Durusdinium trenchii TaxID=1381693 RepID=A0ABP0LWD8_9DINO
MSCTLLGMIESMYNKQMLWQGGRLAESVKGFARAWSARWWMGHYGAKTPKRHVAWSSSPKVGLLNRGKLSWASMRGRDYDKHKTAVTGVSKSGKKTFQGRKQQLKASQWLSSNERWVFQGCYTNEPCCYKGL